MGNIGEIFLSVNDDEEHGMSPLARDEMILTP
jgi:hypothetical protein